MRYSSRSLEAEIITSTESQLHPAFLLLKDRQITAGLSGYRKSESFLLPPFFKYLVFGGLGIGSQGLLKDAGGTDGSFAARLEGGSSSRRPHDPAVSMGAWAAVKTFFCRGLEGTDATMIMVALPHLGEIVSPALGMAQFSPIGCPYIEPYHVELCFEVATV